MQSAVPTLGSLTCFQGGIVLVEIPLFDAHIDFHNVLPDDAACADVEMADLRVAHQAIGQADSETVGSKGGMRMGLADAIHVLR